ncbi:hypothetical protein KUIN1_31070 [Pseudomonas sp. KUIN-1]|nr:hypothetical protein KUIN1_31070 [Pseudomonas sp. KUIN-1]
MAITDAITPALQTPVKNLRLHCSGFLRSEIDEKLSTEIVGMSVGNFLKPLLHVAYSCVVNL